jgi:sulfatase maturation enzyme AslB (radical SAM superfamily)
MAGAMAGSAILAEPVRRETLGTVTLTINNVCNLACPHCYLQYEGPNCIIEPLVIEHLLKSDFERVCIVGKEPLADTRSVERVGMIVERSRSSGKAVSLVTNGLNGNLLPDPVLEKLTWLDLSLDGGRATYESYRRGSWQKLHRSVVSMQRRGLKDLRVLQTLSAATISAVADMVETGFALGGTLIIFSPYQPTRAQGEQGAVAVSPSEILCALEPFASDQRIYLAFDAGYMSRFSDEGLISERATTLFGERFVYVDTDPIDRGIVRVTYDGLILTPFEAVHTDDYASLRRAVLARSLDTWFAEMIRPTSLH